MSLSTSKHTSAVMTLSVVVMVAVELLCAMTMVVHTADASPVMPMERPHRNDATVADAIRYLHQLDHYYGQISRPRFGKRSDDKTASIPVPRFAHPPENVAAVTESTESDDEWKVLAAKIFFNDRR